VVTEKNSEWERCKEHYYTANNMTDCISALSHFANSVHGSRQQHLNHFYDKWHDDALVLDKWFSIQALSTQADALNQIQGLLQHASFNIRNPNKVRAIFSTLIQGNPFKFHQQDGQAYSILGDVIVELDTINPQVASRFCTAFSQWRRFDPQRQELMQSQMSRILEQANVSADVYEILNKTLQS